MVITVSTGPDWSNYIIAAGTLGAVLAAVGIALWSDRKTEKRVKEERNSAEERLHKQLVHSDELLRAQQELSAQQLAEERAAADHRLERQFRHAEELEQRAEAALVEVIGAGISPKNNIRDPKAATRRPIIYVINGGAYTITKVEAKLSSEVGTTFALPRADNIRDLSSFPGPWRDEITDPMGIIYKGTIPPGAGMRFVGEELPAASLQAVFPIVRWVDRWGQCWEHKNGEVYQSPASSE